MREFCRCHRVPDLVLKEKPGKKLTHAQLDHKGVCLCLHAAGEVVVCAMAAGLAACCILDRSNSYDSKIIAQGGQNISLFSIERFKDKISAADQAQIAFNGVRFEAK